MVRCCKFPNCTNKDKSYSPCSFHRLPLSDPKRRRLWLLALQIDPATPLQKLRVADFRVCSDHFDKSDFQQGGKNTATYLIYTAVPREIKPELEDNWEVTGKPAQVRSTGIQVPETGTTRQRPPLQHIVDEEAILQLMKTCPMCNRKCRSNKYVRGPYFTVYQSCYFCHYQRRWGSQPGAANLKVQKPIEKKVKPKKNVCEKTKAQSSQIKKKKTVSESSESHDRA
ncbi:uncharacterized protein zgc:158320 isoform X2 [Notolabrus celidotus]|uniref:uncharacterized protein zgc:158320 isoform X2 n=1 Tax=Notolabrus celidotus TaxID=1203425 RepID=UPI00148F7112|nr:uncharacterized protein zgc:158320 isoform X2 [Notolabrus celidotus]